MKKYEIKRFLWDMGWREFEQFFADFWDRGGWVTTITGVSTGDVNIYISHPKTNFSVGFSLVHKSSSRHKLTEKDVKDRYYGAKPNLHSDRFCLVTTADFDRSAKKAAVEIGFDLADIDSIAKTIDAYDDIVLCEQYKNGFAPNKDVKDFQERLLQVGVSTTRKARNAIFYSERKGEITYVLETSNNTPLKADLELIKDIEMNVLSDKPTRKYPLEGISGPTWRGGYHPAAERDE